MKKTILLFVLAFGVSASAQKKDEITIALNAEFETLNPLINTLMASITVQDATVRQMIILDVNGKPKPTVIKQVPSLENKKAVLTRIGDKQKLKTEIDFLPEAKWGDGQPVTCKDLHLSWVIGRSPNVSASNREPYDNIEDIAIDPTDSKKCSVVFKEAKWNFYTDYPRLVPAHIEGPVFEKYKDQNQGYERNSVYQREPTNPGLYNGPYLIAELKLGSHVIMKPNPHFHGKKPYFKKVVFKFISNTATLESNLKAGTVDMLSTLGMTMDQALAFEKKVKNENLPFEVILVNALVYFHFDFNMASPILADLRVRRAIAHAIDRNEMTKAFLEGRQKPAHHFAAPTDSWFTEDKTIMKYEYSAKKANALLDEAGWKKGPDGIRMKDGKKFSIRISGAADNRFIEMQQVYIQDSLKKVGIELTIKNYPSRVLFPEIFRKRNFDLGMYAWVSNPDESQRGPLHSAMIPSEANGYAGTNRPGWVNKDVDRWIDETGTEFNPKKRIELMRKVLKAYSEEIPSLPLYFRLNNTVIPKGLKGVKPSGHVHTEYLDIENWTF